MNDYLRIKISIDKVNFDLDKIFTPSGKLSFQEGHLNTGYIWDIKKNIEICSYLTYLPFWRGWLISSLVLMSSSPSHTWIKRYFHCTVQHRIPLEKIFEEPDLSTVDLEICKADVPLISLTMTLTSRRKIGCPGSRHVDLWELEDLALIQVNTLFLQPNNCLQEDFLLDFWNKLLMVGAGLEDVRIFLSIWLCEVDL